MFMLVVLDAATMIVALESLLVLERMANTDPLVVVAGVALRVVVAIAPTLELFFDVVVDVTIEVVVDDVCVKNSSGHSVSFPGTT